MCIYIWCKRRVCVPTERPEYWDARHLERLPLRSKSATIGDLYHPRGSMSGHTCRPESGSSCCGGGAAPPPPLMSQPPGPPPRRSWRTSALPVAGRLEKARARFFSSVRSPAGEAMWARDTTMLPVLRYSRLSSARDCDVRAVSRDTSNAAPDTFGKFYSLYLLRMSNSSSRHALIKQHPPCR